MVKYGNCYAFKLIGIKLVDVCMKVQAIQIHRERDEKNNINLTIAG